MIIAPPKTKYTIITFVILALLLIIPWRISDLLLSVNLGIIRFSVTDLFFIAFSLKAAQYFFKVKTTNTFNLRFNKYFTGGLLLLLYGTIIALIQGFNFKYYGLEIRWFLGFFGGLGFALFIRKIDIRDKYYYMGVLCIALLFSSLVYSIIEGKQIIADSVLRTDLSYRATSIQAFSIFFISTITLPYVFTLQIFNRKIIFILPLIFFIQVVIFFLNGIRSLQIMAIISWALYFISNLSIRKILNLIFFCFIIYFTVGRTVVLFENTDYYYIINSTTNRINESLSFFTESSSNRISGTESRVDELYRTINTLSQGDIITGMGIGGLVQDQIGWSESGKVNGIHIAIFNWIIKFGILGIVIVFWFFIETYKLYKEEKFISHLSYINLYSYIALVVWLLIQFISGGLDRWLFFFIFIILMRDNSNIKKNYA